MLVPDLVVLRSGEKNTVFVALDGGKFDPRAVVLGPESDTNMYEVISGLHKGERVVNPASFMLDSESQLREAIEKMRGSANAATESPSSTGTNETVSALSTNAEAEGVVICLPDAGAHFHHLRSSGQLPICGMALVPVTPSELKQLQPGGKVLHYTCPMPEHSSVHSDKPGKCPICGMTLIPVMAPPDAATNLVLPNTTSPSGTTPAAKQLYTCPMHPDVISDKPGQCPKCGMTLVPVTDAAK